MPQLNPYERRALDELRAWQAEPPGWGTRLLAKPAGKIAQAVQTLVPVEALRAALDGANRYAGKWSNERALLQRAGVATLDELRAQPLEVCDGLARRQRLRATAVGGVGGAAFGLAGAAGLVADVPTLLLLALRTIQRTGLCYGEDLRRGEQRHLSIGIFALVSANSMQEKQTAIAALRDDAGTKRRSGDGRSSPQVPAEGADMAWREGIERVVEREMAKEATVYSLQNLARSIGVNLGHRKAASALPVLGAAVGAAVNAWYLNDTARVARYVFQGRWLTERHPRAQLPPPPAGGGQGEGST